MSSLDIEEWSNKCFSTKYLVKPFLYLVSSLLMLGNTKRKFLTVLNLGIVVVAYSLFESEMKRRVMFLNPDILCRVNHTGKLLS